MLEQILVAVNEARISYLLKQLEEQCACWLHERKPAGVSRRAPTEFLVEPDVERVAVVTPVDGEPEVFFQEEVQRANEFVVTYHSPHEDARVTYVVYNQYLSAAQYKLPSRNVFYVHVPPWASIKAASELELGRHVLGTANVSTGEIRLLHSLSPGETTEVLLHETMHLLYPMHDERQIRDLTRTIIGKQYCSFH